MKEVMESIIQLCRHYHECRASVENRKKGEEVREGLGKLCQNMREKITITDPGMLVALMDAYEVTRDEEMLQEVLDVVSGNLEQLEVSGDGVKLLAYCYYYVEEEECLVKAREMLEELRRRGEDVGEAEKVLQNLIIYDL